ncbi:MAG: hypothetical protein F6K47_26045 [Symploca sp. SIO2E6]|nr:hypothetical protein [Symploca sp. SIO2E6]
MASIVSLPAPEQRYLHLSQAADFQVQISIIKLPWNRHLACPYSTVDHVLGKAIAPIGKVIDRAGFVLRLL